LIEDYNYEYFIFRRGCEKKMLKMNNDDYINDFLIPTRYIFEFIKPNKINFGQYIFDWIKTITKFDINKIKRLRVYFNEYL
jgi:hypothetical protein